MGEILPGLLGNKKCKTSVKILAVQATVVPQY